MQGFHHDIYLDLDTKSGFKVRILSSILCVQSEPEIFRFTENNNRARFMGGHLPRPHSNGLYHGTDMASQKGHYVLPQRVALESNALL